MATTKRLFMDCSQCRTVACRGGANGAPAPGIQRQGGIQRVKLQKF